MAQVRPSLLGDGSFVFFVNNLDLCFMASAQFQQDICYNLPPTFFAHAIAVDPQGVLLGMVPRNLGALGTPVNALQVFGLGVFPNLTLLATYPFNSPTIYPETLDFMTNGPWIVFDASDSQMAGGQWGLYLVDRFTAQLHVLAPPIAGYELRNPVFGQTSDDVIAFDAVDTTTGQATILTANLLTGDVRKIADITFAAGVPTFNGDDTAIVFNREDAGVYTTVSLRERALMPDRITPTGAEQPHLSDGAYATVYRRGTFDDSPIPCPEPDATLMLASSIVCLGLLKRRRDRS